MSRDLTTVYVAPTGAITLNDAGEVPQDWVPVIPVSELVDLDFGKPRDFLEFKRQLFEYPISYGGSEPESHQTAALRVFAGNWFVVPKQPKARDRFWETVRAFGATVRARRAPPKTKRRRRGK